MGSDWEDWEDCEEVRFAYLHGFLMSYLLGYGGLDLGFLNNFEKSCFWDCF